LPKPPDIDTSEMLCEHNLLSFNPELKETFVKQEYKAVQAITEEDWTELGSRYNAKKGILMSAVVKAGKTSFEYIPGLCEECVDIVYETNLKCRAINLKKLWVRVPYCKCLPMFNRQDIGKDRICYITTDPEEEVSFLKLKVTQATGISPNEQELSYRGEVLEDSKTLFDYLIVHEGIVKLKLTEELEELPTQQSATPKQGTPTVSKREVEEGFKGSVLASSAELSAEEPQEAEDQKWTCPVCTLENEVGISACVACDAPAPRADGGWACSQCTLINQEHAKECETCLHPRAS